MHLSLPYVVLVCHQYDVSKNSVGRVYVGGYGGLSKSGLFDSRELCPVSFFVVGSRRYINVCNCDMFSVVNVYLDHLMKLCVVCINGGRYVCCSECNVVSNECNDPTSCLVQPIGAHGGEVMCYVLWVCLL